MFREAAWRIFLVILCVQFVVGDDLVVDVDECSKRCEGHQNLSYVGIYDLACDYECRVAECKAGCRLWETAIQSSCQTICQKHNFSMEHPKEFYCTMGCNDAITRYSAKLRKSFGTPLAPALVPDTLNSTSLRLEWNYPEVKEIGLNYVLQWRYEDIEDWQYYKQTWDSNNTIFVEYLQPYTKYKFRVAILLPPGIQPIVSAPSVMISTLPSGVPASPPTSVRAVAVDCTRIRVNWEPGPFPHGHILSYVLRITDNQPNGYSAIKEISAERLNHTFGDLKPNRNYTVSLVMNNDAGPGPTTQISISTPPEPAANDTQKPVLILGAHNVVIEQGAHMMDEPITLYSTKDTITGIAVHITKQLLFISESSGFIRRMSLAKSGDQKSTIVLSLSQSNFKPLDLSIDWLNNQIYILGEVYQSTKMWQIIRCSLDGSGITVAAAGLRRKPYNIEVDPYNGFLFWTIYNGTVGKLYRLDLADISNGVRHNIKPERILSGPSVGAFTADHTNFCLLVSDNRTVYSVSLDGDEIRDLRPKIQRSLFNKVISLAMANKKFYWTDGILVFYEEYHPKFKSYFHNSYPKGRSYSKILINLPSSQPIPVPVNPPTAVQAIFGADLAKITWQAPHLLGSQGKGAWQNWSYEISIYDMTNNLVIIHKDVNLTSCTIRNLTENTEYVIKVAAYTSSGSGPWSSEFKGRSLKGSEDNKYPIILWSASDGLLMSDPTGENVKSIIHKSTMNEKSCKDIAWYKDQIYMVTNTSQIYWYNMSSHGHGQLANIDSVDSIAVDWIGKKLYWSNPNLQLIIRANLNGSQQEQLPIITLAKELNIDAVNAYIYWSTGFAVECAHLNGADKIIYHPAQFFLGNQVMGLTLDMDQHYVYWIVYSREGSNLFRAPMAGSKNFKSKLEIEKISTLQKSNIKGLLCYFNYRLLWLQDDKNAVISDLQGRYIANINGKSLSGLNMVYVMDSSLQNWPYSKNISVSDISVIPELIDRNSIKVLGNWSSFNITWTPIQNVNYGMVFYEIKVDHPYKNKNTSTKISTLPTIEYWEKVEPFMELSVSIRAYTYWDSSNHIQRKIRSPPSTPSEPINLRSFIIYQRQHFDDNKAMVVFRWDSPSYPNGKLEGYKVDCWMEDPFIDICQNAVIPPDQTEYVVADLAKDQIYHYQVKAFTEVGDGGLSETIKVNPLHESPVPKLLASTHDQLFIQDIDANINETIAYGLHNPVQIGALIKENITFWINGAQELAMLNITINDKLKLVDLNGQARSLTVDWLERSLYFTVYRNNMHFIQKLNFNYAEKSDIKVEDISWTDSVIHNIEISPFTRKLYWIESTHASHYRLMECDADGKHRRPLFKQKKKVSEDEEITCNCTNFHTIGRTFSVDQTSPYKPQIIFVDRTNRNIMASDLHGCHCKLIVDKEMVNNQFPIELLKTDISYLYWTNVNRDTLFMLRKNNKQLIEIPTANITDFMIFGQHTQPYPAYKCLLPKHNRSATAGLVSRTSTSITLSMPEHRLHSDCRNVSMATVKYHVYYQVYTGSDSVQCDEKCKHFESFDDIVEVKHLQSYTKYMFSISLSNHYLDLRRKAHIGPAVVYQTNPGAPSKPRNVSAVVLNPTLVEVSWLPPKELNGETVRYEIDWQTEGTITGARQKGEQPVSDTDVTDNEGFYHSFLQKLPPNETYTIWVRAYSETNETSSDSESVVIHIFPEPDNITFLNNTANSLCIQWHTSPFIEHYDIQFSILTSNDWKTIEEGVFEKNEDFIIINLMDLKPKTQYKFRLVLKYPQYKDNYIWPKDLRYTFETLGDKPSPPGVPKIYHINGVYQVKWEPSKDNGAPIEIYMLEVKRLHFYRNKRSANRTAWSHIAPSIEEEEYDWVTVYNGTDTSWIISGLSENLRYIFRVSSYNSYGWSDPSEESNHFDFNATQLAEKDNWTLIIFATSVPLIFILVVAVICVCCCKCCARDKKSKQIILSPRGPDVELATLRELPRRGNFIHNTNVLYISTTPTSDEITLLPHIRRDQITLVKFLGSGAFGEVFEGKAKGLNSNNVDVKVAVKTLRKGASDQEKSEFLQEAQLMSHFKHEHILQLLGVCLDNDPHFIIMELMQGGDLLTYLRNSRNTMATTNVIPPLTLLELLKMCVDVAKGCRYLEEMHYVHRDLACRNCLVSSTETATRIVKIGDFGLARDIYKNDYYRKEGEGLLPVRWMAPESLVDGVFTCQSDVWAFGVLLWEIMTLGQQPYPARNNMEVLVYVRGGGRLGKPTDCPEDLYGMMLKCWSYEAERRPTFKFCLDVLERLHLQCSRDPSLTTHEGQYISAVPNSFDGVSNEAYFQEDIASNNNNNNSGSSWKTASDEDSSRERIPFLQNEQVDASGVEKPKYLELVYDSDCPLDNDGYEIPRNSFRSARNECVVVKKTETPTMKDLAEHSSSGDSQSGFKKVVNELTNIENLLKDDKHTNNIT